MATLISPGVDVRIIHDDFYVAGNAATVPLIFVATEEGKLLPDGVTPAIGTLEHGVLRTVTSIKQAVELFGVPKFYTSVDGQPHHGDARNEYGLDALMKVLEICNRAYVIRANVNLNDNLEDIREMWNGKIAEAGDYLNSLVSDWLSQYNAVNGLLPTDTGYKTTVDKNTLKTLIQEALTDVFASYSFSKDAFALAFLDDHSNPRSGYQDVLFYTTAGYIQGSDITGLESNVQYGATVKVVSSGGTTTHNITLSGSQAVKFSDLITALNTAFGANATASIVQGRIRITSSLVGATSEVEILTDGGTGLQPLFASLNLYRGVATKVMGRGAQTLDIYDDDYTTISGGYDGLFGMITDWTTGAVVNNEFTPAEAEGLLVLAASQFDNTKQFKEYTSLGANDAARRAEIVRALQAAINDPYSPARNEALEYNLVAAPGYPEVADELVRLSQAMHEEVFVVGSTPMDRPPTGPNSIAMWALSNGRVSSDSIGYWYAHGITSNIDGSDILSSSCSIALRTLAYSDANSEGPWIAPAGTTRGTCPQVTDLGYVSGTLGGPTTFVRNWLDQGTRDDLYEFPKSVNPITFIPGRGFLVLGQKTASPIQQASDRINVSRLLKYIKRELRKSLFAFVMEPNDEITRRNIKAAVDNFLATLVDRRGLYDFATICDEDNNSPQNIDANELYVDIAIKPVKAAEFIYARIRVVRTGADIGTKKSIA